MVAIVELLLSAGVPPGAQNNGGQTALHFACGNLPGESTLPRTEEPGLLEFVLNSEIGKSIDVEDYHGIRPIHLAATISEHLLAILIIKGANSTAVTYEGKSLLHIAARTRNPNAIGLLLEHFSAIDRNDLIDATDKNRRTALHEACRSGRPESVDLLLQAGADANAKDNEGLTPLHACAEFEEENLFWSPAASKLTPQRHMLASGVLDSDPLRPEPRDCYGQPYQRDEFKPISTDDDTVRIREIIRLLWTYGAQFIPQDPKDRTVLCPFNQAVTKRVADMVDELLPYMDNYEAQAYEAQAAEDDSHFFNTYVRKYNKALERHLLGRAQAAVFESDLYLEAETADNTHLLDTNTHLLETLLALGKYTAIEQLPAKGIDLLYKPDGGSDFLTTLVQRGYASLLESLAVMIPGHGWVNGKVDLGPYRVNGIAPYIMTAVATRLPNLGVLKALVEKFKADVNIQPEIKVQPSYRDVYVPGPRPLHILALGYHWWQAKGLEYLLNHGANTELKDHNSQTPLHAAVSKGNGSHRQMEAIKILLKHGANPNTIDDEGNTCLNSSMHNIEIVRLLLSAGADLTFGVKSALFPAIASQDVAVVTALLKTGADCNVRSKPLDGKQNLPDQVPTRIPQHEYYPIHYAADAQFNTPNTRETAIQIINLLLDNGADPFLNFRPDESIIHDIFEHGGVLQPFLDLPRLDLERRDPRGRTLLLAASRSGIGTVLPTNSPFDGNRNVPWSDPAKLKAKFGIGDTLPALIVYEKGGDLMAVDNEGNNVLHFLSVAPIHNIDEYQKACSLFIEKAPSLIHQKNARGWKPFHYAIKHQRMWLVEALLNAGADPLGKDPNGDTAIHHLATSISELEWFRKFLELGVPINAKNNEGETALFGVYQKQIYKREELEKRHARFEEAGADIFARNNEGKSLLHIVAPKRWDTGVDTFKFLIEKGLDPMVEDNSQRTSLVSRSLFVYVQLLMRFTGCGCCK
jgi:ankyrin repeat protein